MGLNHPAPHNTSVSENHLVRNIDGRREFLKRIAMPFAAVALLVGDAAVRADDPSKLEKAEEKNPLETTVDIATPVNGPLGDVLALLAARHELGIVFDEKVFSKTQLASLKKQAVQLPRLTNISVEAALRLVLRQADAVYEMQNGIVTVVPRKDRSFPLLTEKQRKTIVEFRKDIAGRSVNLDKPVTVSLKDMMEFLGDRCEIPIFIDTSAFQRAKLNRNVAAAPVTMKAGGSSVDNALHAILAQVEGTYEVHERHLLIVPRK